VTLAVLKGLLAPIIKDDVNFVNAQIVAKDQGITVKETTSSEAEDFLNLITVRTVSSASTCRISGTIYGKNDPRIVKINNFRLEMAPEGHLALIYNVDKPGSIGAIGSALGHHNINIERMQVGQETEGKQNIILLCTDAAIPDAALEELRALSMVSSLTPLEL
jgi:D-3-phosphoglycerate dehydrogenase